MRIRDAKIRKLWSRALQVTEVIDEVVTRLPKKDDTILQQTLKGMSLVRMLGQKVVGSVKDDPFQDLIEEEGYSFDEVGQIGAFLSNADVQANCRVESIFRSSKEVARRLSVDDESILVEVPPPKAPGVITPASVRTASRSGVPDKIIDQVWRVFEGRMDAAGVNGRVQFASFPKTDNPLYGKAQERFKAVIDRHHRYQTDKISRTYALIGLPGTGKTSFAQAFAEKVGGRLMRVGSGITNLSCVCGLIRELKPSFVIIDDFEKMYQRDTAVLEFLEFLQDQKENGVSMLLTANSVKHLDKGMLRPGRIDTWLEFGPPDLTESRTLLDSYLEGAYHQPTDHERTRLLRLASGLTQDYIRDLAERLQYDTMGEVEASLLHMRQLLDLPPIEAEAKMPLLRSV